MTIELQQMRQIIALAEHGSFVRAAATLHISQPALSRSISNVERRFGKDLFLRSGTGVVPTDLGRLYIERARDLLRLADELEGDAIGQGALQRGRVAVGGGPYPAESFLGPAAARLVEHYPQVGVQVRAHNWDELLRQLRGRELDFFVAETSTLAREPDLEIEELPSRHSLHFFARAGHPLAAREQVTAIDTMAWPFATPSRVPPRVLDPMLVRASHGSCKARRPAAVSVDRMQRPRRRQTHRGHVGCRQRVDPVVHLHRTRGGQVRPAWDGALDAPAVRHREPAGPAVDADCCTAA